MRGRWLVAWCVSLSLMLAGCDTTDSKYFRYGIGTELYSADIVQATQFQDIYLTELCRQSLPVLSASDGQCLAGVSSSQGWNLIVQAGLNDIDRRCDSYLAWLDDRRRTNNAVLKELGDITVASQAIMRVAGVSANPITLAGLAFGLAANTFTNVNSRLLLEVDKTTVQTLVLRRRNDFRLDVLKKTIADRPTAVHALRQYLTICTPFTIETDINTTVTLFQQAGAGALERSAPLVDADTIGAAPITARQSVLQTVRPPPTSDPRHADVIANYNPTVHGIGYVKDLLSRLCAPPSEVSAVTPKTNARILAFQQNLRDTGEASVVLTGKLSPREQGLVQSQPPCPTSKFQNLYEEIAFPAGINDAGLIEMMNMKLSPDRQLNSTTASLAQIRSRIPDLREALAAKLKMKNGGLSDQFTLDLVLALQN